MFFNLCSLSNKLAKLYVPLDGSQLNIRLDCISVCKAWLYATTLVH